MTRRQLIAWAQDLLARAGAAETRVKAELLLTAAEGITSRVLYMHPEGEVSGDAERTFRQWAERAARHEPVRYITGRVEFYGLEFEVDPRVLIPRPETELLVDQALAWVSDWRLESPIIGDIGTGCGCIAVTLARHLSQARLCATDASAGALEVARANAARHGVEHQVTFLKGHLLDALPKPVDLVVSNPPYVSTEELKSLPREIRDYEPLEALHGGADGMDAVGEILRQAAHRLRAGGGVIIEIGATQGPAALEIAQRHFAGGTVALRQDYAGLDRAIIARLGAGRP